VAEGRPRLVLAPRGRYQVPAAPTGNHRVALLTAALDDEGALVRALENVDGLVFESFGGGHATEALADALTETARRMPVVLASRTGAGESLRSTYGFAGSERDLLDRGLLSAGWLDGPKARILLTVLLRAGLDRTEIAAELERYLGAS
jgi:L-asparaginase